MKKSTIMATMAVIGICLFVSTASASPKKNRSEGDTLYVEASRKGADVRIQASLADDLKGKTFRAPDVECGRRHPEKPNLRRGHWETRRIWVAPVLEKVWNPGHYNHRRNWVPGQWIKIETQPGYWKTETYWVSNRRY